MLIYSVAHNFSLLMRTSHLTDNDFIQRMLYLDAFPSRYFIVIFSFYMMLRSVCSVINAQDDDDDDQIINYQRKCQENAVSLTEKQQ